jgi:tetratricopeptide (TPR) repeat protein
MTLGISPGLIYLRFAVPDLPLTLMKSIFRLVIALAALLIGTCSISAQETHTHLHEHTDQLGRVNFRTSCNRAAQMQFNHAVAWLHSFEYEEAEKAFRQVTVSDPRCGMGYWGIAMSSYHPLWAPPSSAELQKGASAVEKGKAAGARTQRERDYLAAVEVFYRDADNVDHRTRTFAYSEAMKRLHQNYPSDSEAGVFYGLTLIATGMMSHDKSYAREKEAAQILNRVLAREPQHPGVSHYLIHSYDYPALAELALPAARRYAKIAPASAHAQHMPSHIFTRLGLWQEGIRSNLDAEASAKAFAVRNHLSGVWDEQFHAMDYLTYAYLQGAQDKRARGVLDELNEIPKAEPESFKVAYAVAAIPARYALERRRWDEAAKLELPPLGGFPWQRFRGAEAHIYFARALGAARTGDIKSATREVNKLAAIRQELVAAQAKGDYDWAKQVEIEGMVASAWLAHADRRDEESLRLMRAAADLDDATDKHPVTPGAILPAREQLGELLLELKQPAAALREFETSLVQAPNRFNSLYGAARAARFAGDQKAATSYYGKLVDLVRNADSTRPEIEEAKTYLAGANRRTRAALPSSVRKGSAFP